MVVTYLTWLIASRAFIPSHTRGHPRRCFYQEVLFVDLKFVAQGRMSQKPQPLLEEKILIQTGPDYAHICETFAVDSL